MRKMFFIIIVFLYAGICQAQTTIFTNNCSSETSGWIFTDNGGQPIQKSGYWLLDKDGNDESIISTTYDVSVYTGLVLTFQIKSYGNGSHPTCTVGISNDNGSTFSAGTFTTSSTTTSFVTHTYNIGTINTTQLKIRWVRTPSSGTRGVRIDNIKLEGTLFTGVVNPANFSASAGGSDNIDLSWNQNASSDNVMVAYNTSNTFGTPTDGTSYSVNDAISGGGTVIYNGSGASYNHSGLIPNTTYYYKAWSVDGSTNYSSGVETNVATAKAEPTNHVTGFTAMASSASKIDLSWTENDGAVVPDGYLIKVSTSSISDPTDGTEESNDTDLSDGSGAVNVSHGTSSYSCTGLSGSRTYYFKIYPYTNSGSHIDYKTDGTVPSANSTTQVPEKLIISEVADPKDHYRARFVELYNSGSSRIDFGSTSWYLCRQTNGGSWEDKQLTGSIAAGGTYLLANNNDDNNDDFYSNFGFMADFNYGGTGGNGDDGYFLYKGGNHSSGTLVDAYGVIDEDGTGKAWEYTDSRAYRKSSVTQANTTWTSSEWTIESNSNADDTTPGNYPENIDEQTVSATGDYDFTSSHTGFKMHVNSMTGSDNFHVRYYKGRGPKHVGGISESHVSKYGWHFIMGSSITAINADLKFYVSDLPENSVAEGASTVKLYKRETFGSGDFSFVGTLTYHDNGTSGNQSDDWLEYDGVTGFSEYVMASNDSPLPVELKSFTATVKGNKVALNWATATEVNNYGFQVEREKLQDENGWEEIGFVQGHGNSNSVKYYSYIDNPFEKGSYSYRLKQIDLDGAFKYSDIVSVDLGSITKFALKQNYPNPFNPTTEISFDVPKESRVKLSVYNALGQKVADLLNEKLSAGTHRVRFDGSKLTSGIYFYKMQSAGFTSIKKMILMK